MKNTRLLLLAAVALAAVALFGPQFVHAQDAAAADTAATVTAAPELPAVAVSAIDGLAAKFPWVTTVLSLYASASIGWQILCAAAHNWAARTTDLRDDAWVAKLDTLWWFKLLDRFFYFGGYFGSWAGGKKL